MVDEVKKTVSLDKLKSKDYDAFKTKFEQMDEKELKIFLDKADSNHDNKVSKSELKKAASVFMIEEGQRMQAEIVKAKAYEAMEKCDFKSKAEKNLKLPLADEFGKLMSTKIPLLTETTQRAEAPVDVVVPPPPVKKVKKAVVENPPEDPKWVEYKNQKVYAASDKKHEGPYRLEQRDKTTQKLLVSAEYTYDNRIINRTKRDPTTEKPLETVEYGDDDRTPSGRITYHPNTDVLKQKVKYKEDGKTIDSTTKFDAEGNEIVAAAEVEQQSSDSGTAVAKASTEPEYTNKIEIINGKKTLIQSEPKIDDPETKVVRKETEYDVDANGKETVSVVKHYNAEGKLERQIDYSSDGRKISWERFYDPITGKEIKTHNYNTEGAVNYEGNGKIDEITDHKYDAKGNETKSINRDAKGAITSSSEYKYDDKGNKLSSTHRDAKGNITSSYESKYDAKGNNEISSVNRDAKGSITSANEYKYDEKGNKLSSVYRDAKGAITESYEYKYDEKGNKISCVYLDTKGDSYEYKYDDKDHEISRTERGVGNKLKAEYTNPDPSGKYDYLNRTIYNDGGTSTKQKWDATKNDWVLDGSPAVTATPPTPEVKKNAPVASAGALSKGEAVTYERNAEGKMVEVPVAQVQATAIEKFKTTDPKYLKLKKEYDSMKSTLEANSKRMPALTGNLGQYALEQKAKEMEDLVKEFQAPKSQSPLSVPRPGGFY